MNCSAYGVVIKARAVCVVMVNSYCVQLLVGTHGNTNIRALTFLWFCLVPVFYYYLLLTPKGNSNHSRH